MSDSEWFVTLGACAEERERLRARVIELEAQVKQLRGALEGVLCLGHGLPTREDYDQAMRVMEATRPDGDE